MKSSTIGTQVLTTWISEDDTGSAQHNKTNHVMYITLNIIMLKISKNNVIDV